jgi:hypothetical protein
VAGNRVRRMTISNLQQGRAAFANVRARIVVTMLFQLLALLLG